MWTDKEGRDWSTAISVATIKRVKELAGVLLTDAADTDLVERLYSDVMLLCDVLYAVSMPQAEQRDITSSQFGELLVGDTIDRACESLMVDLIDFFPSGRRPIVTRIVAAARRLTEEKVKLVDQKMSDQQVESMIRRMVARADQEIDKYLAELGDDSGK